MDRAEAEEKYKDKVNNVSKGEAASEQILQIYFIDFKSLCFITLSWFHPSSFRSQTGIYDKAGLRPDVTKFTITLIPDWFVDPWIPFIIIIIIIIIGNEIQFYGLFRAAKNLFFLFFSLIFQFCNVKTLRLFSFVSGWAGTWMYVPVPMQSLLSSLPFTFSLSRMSKWFITLVHAPMMKIMFIWWKLSL